MRSDWTEEGSSEEILGVRFSCWKQLRLPSLSVRRDVAIGSSAILIGLLALAKVATTRLENGDGRLVSAFVILLLFVTYFLPLIVVASTRLKRRGEVRLPLCHSRKRALRVKVRLASGATSVGWLDRAGDRLIFRGERLDFDLSPSDFHDPAKFLRRLETAEGNLLKLPNEIGRQTIGIVALAEQDGGQETPAEFSHPLAKAELQKMVGEWLTAPKTPGTRSLFPPMRPSYVPIPIWVVQVRMVPYSLFAGVLLASIPLLFREYMPESGLPLKFAFGGVLITQFIALFASIELASSTGKNRKLDRLKAAVQER